MYTVHYTLSSQYLEQGTYKQGNILAECAPWCAPALLYTSVADPHHFDADPDPSCHFDVDPDPDPACHFDADADTDPDPSFQIQAQNLEKNSQIGSYSIHFGWSSAN
jgi:hypothetical protein